jgi:hypothetical protein
MMKKTSWYLGLLAFCVFSSSLDADPARVNRQVQSGMMGHSGIALEGNRESAYLNPASLADVKESDWQIFPITGELPLKTSLFKKGSEYAQTADDDSKSEAEKREKLEDFFQSASTSSLGARLNFNPSYTRPNMHVGFFVDAQLDADMRLGGYGSNQLMEAGATHFTSGGVIAYAMSFLEKSLQVGATGKALYRVSPFEERAQRFDSIMIGLNDGEKVSEQLIGDNVMSQKAFGLGFDLGTKYWFPKSLSEHSFYQTIHSYLRPAVGATWQDVGHTRFFRSSGDQLPADIKQSLSVGIGLHPQFSFIKSRFALDIRNLTERKAFLNRIHLGWESKLWNIWSVRAGMSQLYWTLGTGVDFWLAHLDVYITAQEAGDYARLKAQRTIGARFSLGF